MRTALLAWALALGGATTGCMLPPMPGALETPSNLPPAPAPAPTPEPAPADAADGGLNGAPDSDEGLNQPSDSESATLGGGANRNAAPAPAADPGSGWALGSGG